MNKGVVIGIIGGKGKMGDYFARFFKECGYGVIVSDLGTKLSNVELAQKADVVIISVPIEKTVKIIGEIAPHVKKDGLLMDLTSVKVDPVKAMLKSKASVVGCHPMFGPTNSLKNQIVVLSKARGNKWYVWVKKIFTEHGAIVKELTAEKHDELMTVIQGITHFSDITLAHTLAQSGIPIKTFLNYQSPAYRLKLDMMGRILYQDAGLYGNIQIQNPKTPEILKQYLKSVKTLIKIIRQKKLDQFITYFTEGADYLGDFKEKAQKESDLLIEFLNGKTPPNSSLSRGRIKTDSFNDRSLEEVLSSGQKNSEKTNNFQIVTLGPAGSYSDIVARKFMQVEKIEGEVCYAQTVGSVLEKVAKGEIKQAVVPIENKLEGSIRETMDALFESELTITRKLILPIKHSLVALPEVQQKDIKAIYSHEQPLQQCSKYLKENFPNVPVYSLYSTSESMEMLLANQRRDAAAIGSTETARKLGLKILDRNIGNEQKNETHFYVVQVASGKFEAASKNMQTSIAFYFDEDTHGTLFGVLKIFAEAKVNLTRIESRPAGKKMGSYIFYLDFDGDMQTEKIRKILEEVEKSVNKLKILGSYGVVRF